MAYRFWRLLLAIAEWLHLPLKYKDRFKRKTAFYLKYLNEKQGKDLRTNVPEFFDLIAELAKSSPQDLEKELAGEGEMTESARNLIQIIEKANAGSIDVAVHAIIRLATGGKLADEFAAAKALEELIKSKKVQESPRTIAAIDKRLREAGVPKRVLRGRKQKDK